MSKLYFRNLTTDKRFELVSMDKEKNVVTLKGEYSTFTEPYDKERFKKNGYVLEQGDSNAEQP